MNSQGFSRPMRMEEFKACVKNVPLDMTKESLQALFGSCGNVISGKVLQPKEGRNNTMGFVGFATEEEMLLAVEKMNGTTIGDTGNHLFVERAKERDRGTLPARDQDAPYQRKQDYQNGYQNEQSFQSGAATGGYRADKHEQPVFSANGPGRGASLGQQYTRQPPASNGPMFPNNQQTGVKREQAVYNPSGPGRGGVGMQQQYSPSGPGEQAVFNPSGPGRGGVGMQQQYSPSGPGEQAVFNPSGPGRGGVGMQQQYSPSGPGEQAIYNPSGPGRGGVGMQQQQYSLSGPGRGSGLFNGMHSNHANMADQGPYGRTQTYPSQDNSGAQQSLHNGEMPRESYSPNVPQDASLTGRLPYSARPMSQDTYTTPDQSARGESGRTCHKCGEVGHFARECPNQGSQEREARGCHKCGEVGHFARDCPSQGNQEREARSCHKCGEVGHFARECPSQGGQRREGGSTCYRCGETGHFSRECPTSGGAIDNLCHKCGDEGHFARECPAAGSSPEKGDGDRVPPVSYIPPELPSDMDELFQDMPHSGLNFDKYDSIPVQVTGRDPVASITTFEEAGLLEQCSKNIKRAQFTKPTPIQKYAIPIALQGRDLMACAQTGSGKTVAFLVPVLTNMIKQGHLSGGSLTGETQAPAALCIAPTRELAVQIYKEVCKFADGTVVTAAVCYGGVSVQYQLSKLMRGCHFLIATPGRLEDFVSRNRVTLEKVRYLILDEADRMLDMGFEPAIRKLVERSGMPDKLNRQTLLFSATFPDEIQRLAADFLKENYLFVAVGRVGGTNLDICQSVVSASSDEKQEKLFDMLLNSGTDRTLIFVELKRVADFLACLLSGNNFPTTSISGDRTQQEREAALRDFRSGRAPVLVATSVAARGLDIPDVKHVINFDLPQDIEEYVHRIGRTGRIGNKGKATSFFQPGKDDRLARSLVKVLSEAYQEVPEWLEHVAEEAIGSSYGPAGGKFASRDRRERDHSRSGAPPGQMGSVTRGMENLTMQTQSHGGPQHFRTTQNEDNEEEWD